MSGQSFEEIRERLTAIETLVGPTSEDGLRADVKEIKAVMHSMEKRLYIAAGAFSVVYFLAQRLLH